VLYRIINPSDPYTVEASALDVAAMSAVLLGKGYYSFESLDGGENVPLMAFGGAEEWCQKAFQESVMEMCNRVMDTKLSEVADCLDSVLYGDIEDRAAFMEETRDINRSTLEFHRATEQERKCSSMNDIGGRAYIMANKLRQSIADGITTVQ
jgi:hypothetical protein